MQLVIVAKVPDDYPFSPGNLALGKIADRVQEDLHAWKSDLGVSDDTEVTVTLLVDQDVETVFLAGGDVYGYGYGCPVTP